MINKITINDFKDFNRLGELINPKFTKLFQLKNILNSNNDAIFGYYINEKLIAFLHIIISYETIDIINIVVGPKYRKQNVASQLLEYLISKYKDVEKIMLEVNQKNIPAINLYKKHNFKEIYIRKNYYGEDDAIIMKRDVL